MKDRRSRTLLLGCAVVAVLAACGGGGATSEATTPPASQAMTASTTSTVSNTTPDSSDDKLTEAPPIDETTQLEVSSPAPTAAQGDLWQSYSSALSAAEEAEPARSIEELAESADLIVVGTIVEVSQGRMIEVAPNAPSARLQFLNFSVLVTKSSGAAATVTFELPVAVTSPELQAAVDAAVNPVDGNGDGVVDDAEAAHGYDAAGVERAYADHWDQAVRYTIEDTRNRVPAVETLLFLRSVPTQGTYRPVNGDSLILNDAGFAMIPMRADEPSPISTEVAGMSFDSVVDAVLAN